MPGMLAKTSATRLLALSPVPAYPISAGATPDRPSIIGIDDDTVREKSIRLRSAIANGVGSTAAAWLPSTAKGIVPPTVVPASVVKVRLWLPLRKLTNLLDPPR